MSQQETYTKRESYNATASPYMNEANCSYNSFKTNAQSPPPKSQYRYSSPAQSPLKAAPVQQQARHYATPEESESVLPVFSTPSHMYLRQELNTQQRYSPSQQPVHSSPSSPDNTQYSSTASTRQNYTSTQHSYTTKGASSFDPLTKPTSSTPLSSSYQSGRSRGDSTPSKPTMDHFGMNSMKTEINNMKSGKQPERNSFTPTSNSTMSFSSASSASSTKDALIAQLVDMGFSIEASRVAIAASGSTDLQKVLDILVQNEQAEQQIPKSPPSNNRANQSSDDDEEEDLNVEREKEELWKKQQEERRKEYLDQLKRNKPTPPIPNQRPAYSATSTNSSTSSYQHSTPPAHKISSPLVPPQTDPITVYADKERKQGNFFFNKGQYSEAEHAYSLSIGSLPAGHGDLVLLSNNRAAARLKQGKYQDCLTDCSVAIDLARKSMNSSAPLTNLMRDASTNMKAQLIKALHRKACALEGLCLFEAAIQVYEEYVRLEGSRSAQVTQGIMRCQQALLDIKKKQQQPSWKPATSADDNTTAFPDIDFNMFIPKPSPKYSQAQLDEINQSKAVKEMRDREKQKEAEDAEKLEKEDKVNAQISVWKTGKEKNLRALLGSLELILWPGVQWKGVMMSELLEPRKCKVTYMKAIAKVHPDKLPANATVEQRMLANGIFTTLNQAWDTFKTENGL